MPILIVDPDHEVRAFMLTCSARWVDRAQVAAALLAAQLTHGRLPSPFTARDVYRSGRA